jgi:tellurite methyltransferase
MSTNDGIRWDTRYREDPRYASDQRPRPILLKSAHLLPERGLALDVAMGLGSNAGFLLECGLQVIGVDISWVALKRARARYPSLMAVLADLTQFYFPPERFDVILNFYYLQRELWPVLIAGLRPGGILLIETLSQEMCSCRPDIEKRYLLEPGELISAFSQLEILSYYEGWSESETGHPRAIATLVARKPCIK